MTDRFSRSREFWVPRALAWVVLGAFLLTTSAGLLTGIGSAFVLRWDGVPSRTLALVGTCLLCASLLPNRHAHDDAAQWRLGRPASTRHVLSTRVAGLAMVIAVGFAIVPLVLLVDPADDAQLVRNAVISGSIGFGVVGMVGGLALQASAPRIAWWLLR